MSDGKLSSGIVARPGGTLYLNLEGGVEYDFSLLVVDSGGVSRATLGIPTWCHYRFGF